ncbi:hypothetical protein BDM02DRAFT_246803 [Thelephora ganbajun]|uniref:Uncharacterized protein n=1 Tax=Thelephora ganbajun TaxID=370292 RepID=A0ACB6ZAC4_THEGA|nr:hypothetical protein BDM02DRAFT_246803 [Thelephora ganbajun]
MPPRSKRSKKPRQPSQQPTSLGTSTLGINTDLTPDIGPKDVNNGGGSRAVFRGKSEDRRLHVLGALTSTHGREDGITLPREREHDHIGKDTVQSKGSSVVERDVKDAAPRAAAIPVDISKRPAGGFGPLKAILGTISAVYTNYKKTAAVGNKIADLLSRIEALEAGFATLPGNVVEQRRRSELIRKFRGIEGQLRSLSEKPILQRLADHVQDGEEVSGLLEDIREIISDYQMTHQMATREQSYKLINPADASVLDNFRCAQGAEYRHGDRRSCLKGTRTAVLDEIELWTRDFDKPPVYWLNGLAGTGKSTIAQTMAERVFADGQLGASFFCSRDFQDRRSLRFIFPTLAVQLARRYPEYRSIFVPLVQSNPELVNGSLYTQMNRLIVRPLDESDISTVIVIDALDECEDEEPASAILSILGQFVSRISKVKFIFTGRPEPRIPESLRIPLYAEATDVFVLRKVESSQADSDIRLFFKQSFLELTRRRHGLDEWPTEEQLDLLCERAAGLFAYAVATVKFTDHRNNDPKDQLDRLLRPPKSSAREGKTKFKANATLDSLYMSILQEAFSDDDPEDDHKTCSVLAAVILAANPLSPFTIATLLGFGAKDVFLRLSSVHSLLILQENADSPVRPFHKSFSDFIVDPTRCIDQRFHVSSRNHHTELLVGCLNLMNQTLEKNMCKLPDAAANSEVPDLRQRTERYIDSALQYACKSWHKHLVDEHMVRTPKITSALHRFLENKFLFWLEVLSVLGAAREAVDALDLVAGWLEVSPTLELAKDCSRFATEFLGVIDESAPHIYHSALPVSPQTSMVRKLYERHARPLARIVHGLPVSWDPAVLTMKYSSESAAWSPCGRFIAISNGGCRIEIVDAATLKRLTTLESGQTYKLVFSPDARLVVCFHDYPHTAAFTSWDLQTGAQVSFICVDDLWDVGTHCFSITCSACGTMFGALFRIRGPDNFTICTYNVRSGTDIYSHPVKGKVLNNIWTHGECIRFATMNSGSITTWEVGFASGNTPTEVESLPLPANLPQDSHPYLFHPTLSRLVITHSNMERILVWDARHSKSLLNGYARLPNGISFSSGGRFFIYGTRSFETHPSEIYLWKESPTGYILHRKLNCEIEYPELSISPNGETIFVCGGSVLQLWHPMDPPTSFSCEQTHERFILEFSPDETLAAVTRFKDKAVTVLDLESGDPLSIVDTGTEVYGQRVTGSTVVAICHEKIVTWNLPTGNRVLNPKASVIWTATFSCPETFSYSYTSRFASISPDLHRIAIVQGPMYGNPPSLYLHDVPTGQLHGPVFMREGGDGRPWFTSDGRQVWYIMDRGEARGLAIVEDSESGVVKLENLEPTRQPPHTPPWLSSRGYQVVDNRWILGFSGKRLLWLPPHWQSLGANRTWGGRFLALLHGTLPEAVILEFEE